MRNFVYEQKQSQGAPDVWGPLLMVERDFLEGAEKEWKEVLTLWPKDSSGELENLFLHAAFEARGDVIAALKDRIPDVEDLLATFVAQLQNEVN